MAEIPSGTTPDSWVEGVLDAPDWTAVVGGVSESAWVEARDLKFALTAEKCEEVLATFETLAEQGALFRASPKSLKEVGMAAQWYVALIGYSQKALGNLTSVKAEYGLSTTVKTAIDNLNAARPVSAQTSNGIVQWLNGHIDRLWLEENRDPQKALMHVMAILGASIVGQSQNAAGNAAVLLLCDRIAEIARSQGYELETLVRGQWEPTHKIGADPGNQTRVNGCLVLEVVGGGNHPDIRFTAFGSGGGSTLAVAEVKGRKDLSNTWESWMPQVVSHMHTWKSEYPTSLRLMFGTVITREMVEGESALGTSRQGLRQLHEDDLLHGVFNVFWLALGKQSQVSAVEQLLEVLLSRSVK